MSPGRSDFPQISRLQVTRRQWMATSGLLFTRAMANAQEGHLLIGGVSSVYPNQTQERCAKIFRFCRTQSSYAIGSSGLLSSSQRDFVLSRQGVRCHVAIAPGYHMASEFDNLWKELVETTLGDEALFLTLNNREVQANFKEIVLQMAGTVPVREPKDGTDLKSCPLMIVVSGVQVAGNHLLKKLPGGSHEVKSEPYAMDFDSMPSVTMEFVHLRHRPGVVVQMSQRRFLYPDQKGNELFRVLEHNIWRTSSVGGQRYETRSHVLGRRGDAFHKEHERLELPLKLSRPRSALSAEVEPQNRPDLAYYDVIHGAVVRLVPDCLTDDVFHAFADRWAIAFDPTDPKGRFVINESTLSTEFESYAAMTCSVDEAIDDALRRY